MEETPELSDEEFEFILNEFIKTMVRNAQNDIERYVMATEYKHGEIMCYMLPQN